MSTFYNIDNFKSTSETYLGDTYNIYNDGSAIALGSEPGVSLDTVSLTGDSTVIVLFKTSSLLTECIWSVDDGAGGRYIDVMHSGGNTVTLYYEGVSTSIQYTDEVTLPVDQWIAVGFAYDLSENTIYFGAHFAGVNNVIAGDKFSQYLPTTAPQIPATRIFRFFRPADVDSNYFNGSIDTFRISSSLYLLPITHVSEYVFTLVSQATKWVNTTAIFTRFSTPDDLAVSESTIGILPIQKYSNMCPYDTNRVCMFLRESFGSVVTASTTDMTSISTRNIFFQTTNTGMHYFESTGKLIYVNMHTNGDLNQLFYVIPTGHNIQPTQKVQITTLAANGTYYRCRGELHGRYLFGVKLAIDGSTHQIFRTDADGLNEITVDCLTLLGVNAKIETHVCNSDDDLLYFSHPTTDLLKSVDFDLANLDETHTLTLNSGKDSSIEYADGYLYYGNKNPGGSTDTTSLWRYNLETGVNSRFSYATDIDTTSDDNQIMYIDRPYNRMILSANTTASYLVFDDPTVNFALPSIFKGFRNSTSVDMYWEAIDLATGYNILQDGVIVASNISDIYFTATGLVEGSTYRFTLEYTTDGTTFIASKFHNTIYVPSSTASYFPEITTLNSVGVITSTAGWVDPYDPTELIVNVGGAYSRYNINTGVITSIGDLLAGLGNVQERQLSNKRIYHIKTNTSILMDAGVNAKNRTDAGGYAAYVNSLEYIVFDHSLVSSPTDTAFLMSFSSSNDGSFILYSTQSEELWRYDSATNVSTKLFTSTTATANMRGVSLDPLDQESAVFYDNNILRHINLTTLVVTELLTDVSAAIMKLHGGVIYGCRWFGSFYRMDVDGTNYQDLMKPGENFLGLFIDAVNKRVVVVEADGQMKVHQDSVMPDLPDDPSVFVVTPRPISLDIAWQPVDGALGYGVQFTVGSSGESTNFITSTAFTDKLKHPIRNLQPGSTYTVYLYYTIDSSNPSLLLGSAVKSTLPNVAGNYDKTSYEDSSGGGFDVSDLNSTSLESLGEVMNELFDTGDELTFTLGGREVKTSFVKVGETVAIDSDASIAVGFTGASAGQSVDLTLSDTTTVNISYNEGDETITVPGVANPVSSGESFILDGKKVTLTTF